MAGGKRKKNPERKGNEKKSDHDSADEQGEQNSNPSTNSTPAKKTKLSLKKQKSSPRKAGKGRKRTTETKSPCRGGATIRFEEDGNEIILDVQGMDVSEFPSDDNATQDSELGEDANNNATLNVSQQSNRERPSDSQSEGEEGEVISPEQIRCTGVNDLLKYAKAKKREGRKEEKCQDPQPSTSNLSSEEMINQAICKTMERMEEIFQARLQSGTFNSGQAGTAMGGQNPGIANLRPEQIQVPLPVLQRGRGNFDKEKEIIDSAGSEITIYNRAIQPEGSNEYNTEINQYNHLRDSTSSEEAIDKSDELIDLNKTNNGITENMNHLHLIGGADRNGGDMTRRESADPSRRGQQQQQPRQYAEEVLPEEIARERADYVVRQAEANKARILEVPGKINELTHPKTFAGNDNENVVDQRLTGQMRVEQLMNGGEEDLHYVVDEKYLVIGNYVEDSLRNKIEKGEYVDFSKLLPRDRTAFEEDTRMELINKDGHTYFVPARNGGTSEITISNFSRWEQAFRVYSNIYTRKFPHRSSQLIQYNHIIYTASLAFHWDNVYLYDKEFRLHMSLYPKRSWAIILQQAWTMRMKDRIIRRDNGFGRPERKNSKKDICWHYNKGRCTYGNSCKFEHKCNTCNKYGHGEHICRRASKGDNNNNKSVDNRNQGNFGGKREDNNRNESTSK